MVNKILALFWGNTKRQDDKRIATLKMPDGIYESNDHRYINDLNKYHKLDVYYPEGTTEKLPVIIDIHGGGWMYGDKELNKPYCLSLAKRGNVVFNMSYRLFPNATPDEQLRDISKALKWIYDNLDNYPCDKNSICLTGDSAGGMLAFYTAMLSVSEELRKAYGTDDFKLKFNAVGLTSPVPYMDDGSVISVYTKHILGGKSYKKQRWSAFVNADKAIALGKMPPTFLVTSSGDTVAMAQTKKTAELIESSGTPCLLLDWDKYEGKDLPHVFSVIYPDSEPSSKTIDEMLSFFKKYEGKI